MKTLFVPVIHIIAESFNAQHDTDGKKIHVNNKNYQPIFFSNYYSFLTVVRYERVWYCRAWYYQWIWDGERYTTRKW